MAKSAKPPTPSAAEAGNGSRNDQPDTSGSSDAIELAEALRNSLRTATAQAGELITALRQQKKANKSVQTALATLRQLEKVTL